MLPCAQSVIDTINKAYYFSFTADRKSSRSAEAVLKAKCRMIPMKGFTGRIGGVRFPVTSPTNQIKDPAR